MAHRYLGEGQTTTLGVETILVPGNHGLCATVCAPDRQGLVVDDANASTAYRPRPPPTQGSASAISAEWTVISRRFHAREEITDIA